MIASNQSFKLSESFIDRYKNVKPPFGFGGMGEFVYKRTYSRVKPDGTNEEWWETIRRVVEGTMNMQKRHIEKNHMRWNKDKGMYHAEKMYDIFFNMKALPPGRGLWAMGTKLTEERGIYAALNNCAFVSTEDIADDPSKPFKFLMDMSMLGVGVGFDVKGAGKVRLFKPRTDLTANDGDGIKYESLTRWPIKKYHADRIACDDIDDVEDVDGGTFRLKMTISDDREGWVDSLALLIESYTTSDEYPEVVFDYSQIRPKGRPIKCFGGTSSGPEPLRQLHEKIREIFDKETDTVVQPTMTMKNIVDIMNLIGKCVVAGNVRRTAEIAFGDPNDEGYVNLKDIDVYPERNDPKTGWGWSSNNSVFAELGMNYKKIVESTVKRGEPGFAWLSNMQKYGRMQDPPNDKDHRAMGGNPCLEQTLESYELCCLVETNPLIHESFTDFLLTLKYSYMYAKTVTLGMTHWPETNRVILRNRRIGTSVTGVAQFADVRGLDTLKQWLDSGYKYIQTCDNVYSEWFAIPKSIKTTSVKPSGTVSIVMGVWPGMHRPDSRYIKRAIRVSNASPLLKPLIDANYTVEPSVNDPDNTSVVYFPIDMGEGKTNSEVSIWQQSSFACFLQKWWADNQVSCTISFNPETESHEIEPILNHMQYYLKGISFLPRLDYGAYPQMPNQMISKEEYDKMIGGIKNLNMSSVKKNKPVIERYCDGDTCVL